MKTFWINVLSLASLLGSLPSAPAQTPAPSPAASGARIAFATPAFDFGKVSAGEVVKHAFVFTNTGTSTLEITDVHPGCGCTTAGTWDKRVEPGKTGSIPLQFNSANFGGRVAKTASVTSNDPEHPTVMLQITGTVWKPIEVTPTMVIFNVSSESEKAETKVVRIVSNLDEPLTLSDVKVANPTFKAELKTVQPGKEFELLITAIPPFNTSVVSDVVKITTSSKQTPEINTTAYLTVQQPVMISPAQLMVPAGPLASATRLGVSIRNNWTNSLVLSESAINVPGATITVQETQPGRAFFVSVNFPAGLQISPNQQVELTIKSNHPKFALIKVPVYQPQAPGAASLPNPVQVVTPPAGSTSPK
jgi:hypothetical protein